MTYARSLLLAAALVLVFGGPMVAPEPPPWWRLALAVGVMVVAHVLRQRFRLGVTVFYLAWGEAALIIGLFLVPAGWVPPVVATGCLISAVLRWLGGWTSPPGRVLEVVAGLTVAGAAGAAATRAIADPYGEPLSPS
ncbi:MAG: hypothetical protein ACRDT2_21695, partial [Natronosporangium sp.]